MWNAYQIQYGGKTVAIQTMYLGTQLRNLKLRLTSGNLNLCSFTPPDQLPQSQ